MKHSLEWREGTAARDAGDSLTTNPYEPASREYDDWRNGWEHADEQWRDIEREEREADSCAHEWSYSGTAYGGDDPRYMGEGRVRCVHCGADGDA